MRVMFLSPTGQLGGAETSLLEILASLGHAQPSWRLHLLTAADGPLVARASALGVETTVLPWPASVARLGEAGASSAPAGYWRLCGRLVLAVLPTLGYLKRLRAAIRRASPDIVHTNGLKMHLLGVLARTRAPVVWHLHDYLGPRPMTSRLLRWHAARPAAVIANSASVADDVRAALGHGVRVVPIYNGIDLDRFSPHGDRLDLDALSGLPPAGDDVVRVGLLGTFGRWKGHATFLQALARVPRTLPVRGYVIGGALYQTDASQYSRAELAALAASLGLADRVGFTGVVDRPEAALRALDVVVHASTEPEPFGLVIVEAMACGRAVIVSDAGGAAEIITPDVDALAHRPGDAGDLAERIAALASDRYYRTRLGRAGRASAEHRFGRARLAAELVPVYEAVTAS